jgi:glucokinase
VQPSASRWENLIEDSQLTSTSDSSGQWLVADIGGTRLRAALSDAGGPPHAFAELACADYPGPAQALQHYLSSNAARPVAACLAVAGPVAGDEFRFTNNAWAFSIEELRCRLGLERLLLKNDFEALALALPTLAGTDLHPLGLAIEPPSGRHTLAVVGPGTGLGVAALVPHAGCWIAQPGEGGHIGFAPQDDLEREVERVLRRSKTRVTNEDILSGAGLAALYRAIGEVEGHLAAAEITPAEVTQRALAGADAVAERTVDVFCAVLGAVAGDVALVTGARGGVFIGGGIASRILPLLERSRFRQRFEDKGVQSGYVRAIGTSAIVSRTPTLTGALAALHEAMSHV